MNRSTEIEGVLEYYKEQVEKSENFTIFQRDIYNFLERYGITQFQLETYEEKEFKHWKEKYKNDQFLNVYESPVQKGFLQFNSSLAGSNHYKMYISLDREHLTEGVDRIFDFISKNKIENCSKVARRDRSDVIVLRILKEEDAKKVLEFINNDKFITEHARPTNPFLMREGVVGVAFDGHLSYNFVVSYLMREYLKTKKENNDTQSISKDDFTKYIRKTFKEVFLTNEGLQDFISQQYVQRELYNSYGSHTDVLLNFMHVINMAYTSMTSEDINDYFAAFKVSENDRVNAKYYAKLDYALNHGIKEEKQEIKQEVKQGPTERDKQIIDSYISYALKKYKYPEEVERYLSSYQSGNVAAITRDGNFRMQFAKEVTSEDLRAITNGNIRNYIQRRIAFEKGEELRIQKRQENERKKVKSIKEQTIAMINGIESTYKR